MVTPSRMATGTSFSNTISTGSGRNMGPFWWPAGRIRTPGSKAAVSPFSGPPVYGLVGT